MGLRDRLRERWPLLVAVGCAVSLYAPWLNAGYVNLEYPFHLAARSLAGDQTPGLMEAYFDDQANPLGYSLILAFIYRIVGISSTPWIARLPSLAGAVLMLWAGWHWYRARGVAGRATFGWWAALVVSHPMIAAFSTHGTADLLPAALVLAAIVSSVVPSAPWSRLVVASGLAFSVGVGTKYSVAFFGPGLVYAWYVGRDDRLSLRRRWATLGGSISAAAIVLIVMLSWMWSAYGVWISSKTGTHSPNFMALHSWLGGGAGYLVFAGLFVGAVPLIASGLGRRGVLIASGLGLAIWLGRLAWPAGGELDFGNWAGAFGLLVRVLEAGGAMLAGSLLVALWLVARRGESRDHALLCAIGPAFLVLAAARPSQRYLIGFVPMIFLLLLRQPPRGARRLLVATTVVGFAVVSIVGLSYLRAQGDASERVARWAEQERLLASTSPGAICPHACHYWVGVDLAAPVRDVIAVSPSDSVPADAVFSAEVRPLGRLVRTYAVVPVEAGSGG